MLSIHDQLTMDKQTISNANNWKKEPHAALLVIKQPTREDKSSKSNKIRAFSSRLFQKALVLFQSLFRSIECSSIVFISIASLENRNYFIPVTDLTTCSNNICYIYCESLPSFVMELSCFAHQLAIYYLFNIESTLLHKTKKDAYSFIYILLTLNVILFIGIFILQMKHMVILYGIVCAMLSIYKMHRQVIFILNHKTNQNNRQQKTFMY